MYGYYMNILCVLLNVGMYYIIDNHNLFLGQLKTLDMEAVWYIWGICRCILRKKNVKMTQK